ncbi:uncharacterized protein LOC131168023 [Malania oleifera]|uniref:uncharacterized protein LOC131168023 n=1 Tax=Malania oleifera TaxID=397392 RepID=UPI0025AE275D|nr:uncharacterized protein LOC131168023 [Malania oleifera]
MKALASSYARVFAHKNGDGCLSCPRDLLSRPEVRFLGTHRWMLNVRFSQYLVSLRRRPIHPVSTSSSSLFLNPQACLDAAETQTQDLYQSHTVHVRFKLQKECLFGERFFIVGDDPMFGLWDPSIAVPLDWSDGHLWTLEMDIPIGKSIQFKFILKGSTEEIIWQPGPNRILQTWETKNTITIIEHWENDEFQRVIEEEPVPNANEESKFDSEASIVAKNVTRFQGEFAIVDGNISPSDKPMTEASKEQTVPEQITHSQEKPMAIVAENTNYQKQEPLENVNKKMSDTGSGTYPKVEPENIPGNNGMATTVNTEASTAAEENVEGGPVLVPGLTLLSMAPADEENADKDEKSISIDASIRADEFKGRHGQKLDEKQEPESSTLPEELTELSSNGKLKAEHHNELEHEPPVAEEQQPIDSQPNDNDALRKDMQWGRKTLEMLLTNLGLI